MPLPSRPSRRQLVAAALAAALLPASAFAGGDDVERAARSAVEQAWWPADVVRLADDYLRHHRDAPAALEVAQRRERARVAAQVLRRRDVTLFRAAFVEAAGGDADSRADVRLAALGDLPAIRRMAARVEATDSPRWVGWMQFGARLGDDDAAYELALHYRREDQPLLAQVYESQALALGHVPPPALEQTRK
jgi:hypothetical protein